MSDLVNLSGYGFQVTISAIPTFPVPITITEFPDDTDSLDISTSQIVNAEFGLNAHMAAWQTATGIDVTLSVFESTESDRNLAVLFEANRVQRGRRANIDTITMVCVYPDGSINTFSQGVITSGFAGTSIQSSGRKKTKTYGFRFANLTTVNSVLTSTINSAINLLNAV